MMREADRSEDVMHLAGRVALVTGATGGIGRATAHELAGAGAQVVVSGRDPDALGDIAKAVGGYALPGDLTRPGALECLVQNAERLAGPIDVLVNNAGRGHSGSLATISAEEIDSLLYLDLSVPIHLSRLVLPGMLGRRLGRIVMVGSIAGLVGVGNEAVYAAAKGGLAVLADSLSDELAGTGVGVTLIAPGAVATRFFQKRGSEYTRRVPRLLTVERVATAIREGIEDDRRRVVVPRWLELAIRMHGGAPSLYRALSARWG
jgi:short-subunit dehydrogenase